MHDSKGCPQILDKKFRAIEDMHVPNIDTIKSRNKNTVPVASSRFAYFSLKRCAHMLKSWISFFSPLV